MISQADKFLNTLHPAERRAYKQFESVVIEKHLKRRVNGDPRSPFVVDRRNALLGWEGRVTITQPPEPGRPEQGRSTTDRVEAEFWVTQHYAPQYWRKLHAADAQKSLVEYTVKQAADRYIESLYEKDEEGTSTPRMPRKHKARVSKLKKHVMPALGPLIFTTLRADFVTEFLKRMTITPRETGKPTKRAAMRSTKRETLHALYAVWRFTFENDPCPFQNAHIDKVKKLVKLPTINANDLPAMDKELRKLTKKGVMSPSDVTKSLVGAIHWDSCAEKRRHLKHFIPNSAHIVALLVGLGVRVSELVTLRWQYFNLDELFVLVPQSKLTTDADGELEKDPFRIVPLQRSLLPWLQDLMRIYGIHDHRNCSSFVVQLTQPKIHSDAPANEDSVSGRVSNVLKHAGTKIKGKSTHFGRATHISIASTAGTIPTHLIKAFVGHAPFKGDVTDTYFKLQREHLKPAHRRYLHLPSVTEVALAAKGFKPESQTVARSKS